MTPEQQKALAIARARRRRAEAEASQETPPQETQGDGGGLIQNYLDTVTSQYKSAYKGLGRGMLEPLVGAAQLGLRGGESLAGMVSPEAESTVADWRKALEGAFADYEQRYQANPDVAAHPYWAGGGRIAGNVATTAPLAYAAPGAAAASLPARMAAGAATGAAAGAVQPAGGEDYWTEKGIQTGLGGVTGAAMPTITGGIARMVRPKSSPAVRQLQEMGVSPTPGQALGPVGKRVEESATSVPIVGDVIRTAQRRSVLAYNKGILNKALEPIGKKLPKDMPVGREAINYAGDAISDAYERIVPKLTAQADNQFVDDFTNLISLTKNMIPKRAKQFESIIREKVAPKVAKNGTITGESLKEIESELGRLATNFTKTTDADQRLLGDALKEAQAIVRNLVKRSNPSARAALDKVDSAYARLLRVENAAARAGSKEGIFSPAAFRGAVKQTDRSLRHRKFARGKALMQDIAESGEEVLGPTVPDSGTLLRMLTGAGLLGGLGYIDPVTGAAVGSAVLPYTPVGQRLMASALTSRPAGAEALARGIRAATPALTVTPPALTRR